VIELFALGFLLSDDVVVTLQCESMEESVMSTTLEQIISDRVQNLTPEQQKIVLEFVEEIIGKPVERKPLWKIAEECREGVPQEAIDSMPVDASENFDHYLYGAPKK
jgi:hypothetical protein